MPDSSEATELLEVAARVLLRCIVLGFLLLLVWFGAFASGLIHAVHGKLFGLTPHELDAIHYCGMAFVKSCVLLFFVFPWIAIRLVLRNKAK